jgi:hypothetical protein
MQPAELPSSPIEFPWGRSGSITLNVPSEWSVQTSWPDLSGALDDYGSALRQALDHPEGDRLELLVRAGSKVAIVVDDPSRWTPVRDVLPVVLERLHALGIEHKDICICVGVGRHHVVNDQEMRTRVGDAVVDSYLCYSPPVDDMTKYVDLGTTPQGVPVRAFRPVAEANLRILIGSVLPHLQAGFGGGYKLIFPGCSHRSTLGALHRQGLGGNASRLLGSDPKTNPMREAIRSAAALLPGDCYSISHLLGEVGQVFQVVAGNVDEVQTILSSEAKRRFRVPNSEPADVVIAGNDPYPGDPMMSFKVLINHRAAVKPSGLLIGYFWTDVEEIDRSFPMAPMKAIAASGAVGGWIARHGLKAADRITAAMGTSSQFMIRWARELVVDRNVMVYSPPLRERIGPRLGPIRLFSNQEELWEAARKDLRNVQNPTARIFPRGGLTYCS